MMAATVDSIERDAVGEVLKEVLAERSHSKGPIAAPDFLGSPVGESTYPPIVDQDNEAGHIDDFKPEEEDDQLEEEDEECAWAPGSPTGRQGSDLMAAKRARQLSCTSPIPSPLPSPQAAIQVRRWCG